MTLSVPGDSSVFYMIAGGNTSLRLYACSHLFDSEIEFAAFVKTMPATAAGGHRLTKPFKTRTGPLR